MAHKKFAVPLQSDPKQLVRSEERISVWTVFVSWTQIQTWELAWRAIRLLLLLANRPSPRSHLPVVNGVRRKAWPSAM
jgi:hypothetical protein